MKFLVATGCLLAGLVLGDMQKMMQSIKSLHSKSPNATLRGLGDFTDDIFLQLNAWGCWCYFDEDYSLGRSQPVNEIDELCRTLHDGYECILMDRQRDAGDINCIPWEQEYSSGVRYQFVSLEDPRGQIRKVCARNNRNNKCAELSCMVENYFTARLLRLLYEGIDVDHKVKVGQYGFSRENNCPSNKGPTSPRECCGTYPVRFPYKTEGMNGDRDCCGEHTYWTAASDCCAGNVVRVSC